MPRKRCQQAIVLRVAAYCTTAYPALPWQWGENLLPSLLEDCATLSPLWANPFASEFELSRWQQKAKIILKEISCWPYFIFLSYLFLCYSKVRKTIHKWECSAIRIIVVYYPLLILSTNSQWKHMNELLSASNYWTGHNLWPVLPFPP